MNCKWCELSREEYIQLTGGETGGVFSLVVSFCKWICGK